MKRILDRLDRELTPLWPTILTILGLYFYDTLRDIRTAKRIKKIADELYMKLTLKD